MEAKTKKIIFFIGAIFVGVIFLTSYAAFSNNNAGNTSTTTIKAPTQPTIFATGHSNAIITGYGQVANVKLLNISNSTANKVDALMSALEANGSIDNYLFTNNSYEVYSSSLSAYALQGYLNANMNSSNSIAVGSTAEITIPSSIVLYYSNSSPPVSVPLIDRNYTLYLNNVTKIGTNINLSLSALITENGLLYNNQLRISLDTNAINAPPQPTELATGYANALILGYADAANVKQLSNSSSTANMLSNLMSQLKENGSISDYAYANGIYDINLSSFSAYALQMYVFTALNSSNSVLVGSTAKIMLPKSLTLYYSNSSRPINIPISARNYTIYLNGVGMVNGTVNLSVSALVTNSGLLYNNQLKLSRG